MADGIFSSAILISGERMDQERATQEIINQWCTMDEHADVAFLSAPVTYPPIPSMALSIFQATLDAEGISSKVIYTMFLAMHLMGTGTIHELNNLMDLFANGDLLFAHLTDVPTPCTTEDYLSLMPADYRDKYRDRILEILDHALSAAEQIVDASARKVINMGARILAISSIYSQQNASLAVMKRVKELDPSVTTIIGGFNISGEAGLAVLRNFPSVDYVSFGEGDETIAEVCRNILDKSDAPMPYGIVGRNDPVPDPIPYRLTKDLDTVKTPEYRDFFREKEMAMNGFYGDIFTGTGIDLSTVIFLEGSRGCWWGQHRSCAFCGLNGLTRVYREKSVQHFHEELQETMRRYPDATIQLSDNVLSKKMIDELLPMLAADNEKYHMLGEVKTNLNFRKVKALVDAGFYAVQPGIEGINDHLLTLMGKGSSAAQNIALLKYSASCGIYPIWNLLFGMPGEERTDYEETLELMPLIQHLQPPSLASRIRFSRFARYGISPEEFGLELGPSDAVLLSYRGNDDLIRNMGPDLQLTGGPFLEVSRQNYDLYIRLHKAVTEWRKAFYSGSRPQLVMSDSMLGLMIFDSRTIAPSPRVILLGLKARLYRLASDPIAFNKIIAALPDDSEEDIRRCLDDLVSQKLMLCISNRYIALATEVS